MEWQKGLPERLLRKNNFKFRFGQGLPGAELLVYLFDITS